MSLQATLRARGGRRLGRPHFAFLRSIVEGVSTAPAAQRYLGSEGPNECREAHHDVVEALRTIALRYDASVWERLAGGVELRRARAPRPSLDVWAESRGIDPAEWGEAELLEMFHEAHPPEDDEQAEEKVNASQRRERLELLRALEARVGEAALPEHALEGWFDEVSAARLRGGGVATVGELQLLIARGGRWFASMEAIGPAKAAAIESYLHELLPALPAETLAFAPALAIESEAKRAASGDQVMDAPPAIVVSEGAPPESTAISVLPSPEVDPVHAQVASDVLPVEMRGQLASAGLDGRAGLNRQRPGGLAARDDIDAVAAWLCARCGHPGSPAYVKTTAVSYRQQVRRLLLWCTGTRRVALSSMKSADCAAYATFLADIPDEWISKTKAPAWSKQWRPFAGQLTASSREQALRACASMFEWLAHDAQYLKRNPWKALKLRQPDDRSRRPRTSRAFTPQAWGALLEYLRHEDMNPQGESVRARQRRAERARMSFVLEFNEPCGLRATEFVSVTRSDLQFDGGTWTLHVHGKGSRNRVVIVPPQAVRALETYFRARGYESLDEAPATAPLLAQLMDESPLTYAAFYEAFRDFVRSAIGASTLTPAERAIAEGASTHWLRHTAAVRLDERGADAVVIKDHLGHANLETTMNYLKSQERRRAEIVRKAFL